MWWKSASVMAIVVLTAAKAAAQDPRVEISATAGWTFSNGVTADSSVIVPGVGTFNSIDPKDAFSWGLRLGFFATENHEIGFLFNQQATELELRGTTTVKLGDLSINNYHGYYAYNFGDVDAAARPYILFGLGATKYGDVTATASGTPRDISSVSRFSGTGAVGVKVYPGENVGILLESRWTPTYITTTTTGYWCDPYWGCYLVGNSRVLAPVRPGRRHLVPILTVVAWQRRHRSMTNEHSTLDETTDATRRGLRADAGAGGPRPGSTERHSQPGRFRRAGGVAAGTWVLRRAVLSSIRHRHHQGC